MTLTYENLLPLSCFVRRPHPGIATQPYSSFLSFQDAFNYLVKAYHLSGKKILLPAFYCHATISEMKKSGIEPVFVASDPALFDVDVADFKKKLSEEKPDIIVIYNFFGKNSVLYDRHHEWEGLAPPDAIIISDFAHTLIPLHKIPFYTDRHFYIDSTRKSTPTMMSHLVAPPRTMIDASLISKNVFIPAYLRLLFFIKGIFLRLSLFFDSRLLAQIAMKLFILHDNRIGAYKEAHAGFKIDAWLYKHIDFEKIKSHRKSLHAAYRKNFSIFADQGHIGLFDIPAAEHGNLCFFFAQVKRIEKFEALVKAFDRAGFWVDRMWDFDAIEDMSDGDKLWGKSIICFPYTVNAQEKDIEKMALCMHRFFNENGDET
jgi:hypothetical protein